MEFINKVDLIQFIDDKLKNLAKDKDAIRSIKGTFEEKHPQLDAINLQNVMWLRIKAQIEDIPTFQTENLLIIKKV